MLRILALSWSISPPRKEAFKQKIPQNLRQLLLGSPTHEAFRFHLPRYLLSLRILQSLLQIILPTNNMSQIARSDTPRTNLPAPSTKQRQMMKEKGEDEGRRLSLKSPETGTNLFEPISRISALPSISSVTTEQDQSNNNNFGTEVKVLDIGRLQIGGKGMQQGMFDYAHYFGTVY